MSGEIDDIDLKLEAYFSSSLSPEEQEAFEAELQSDADLEARFQLGLKARAAAWSSGRQDEFAQLRQRYDQKETKIRPMNRSWIAIAAAAVGLLLLVAYLFYDRGSNPEELYMAYYSTPPAPVPRGVEAPPADQLGYIAYNQGNYEDAIGHFQTHLQDTADLRSRLFMGVAYLELRQYENAESILEPLSADTLEASWYWAMLSIHKGDYEIANSLLLRIEKDRQHLFQDKAQKLREDWGKD